TPIGFRPVIESNNCDSNCCPIQRPRFVGPCQEDIAGRFYSLQHTSVDTMTYRIGCKETYPVSATYFNLRTAFLKKVAAKVRQFWYSVCKNGPKLAEVPVT